MLFPALPVPQNRTFIRTLHGSSKPQRADGVFGVPGIKKLVASDMTLAASWKGWVKLIYFEISKKCRRTTQPAFWRLAPLRRAFESLKGGVALFVAEPKKKRHLQSRCPFLLSFVAEKDTVWKALRLNGFRVLRNLWFCFSALFSSHFRTPL